MDRQKVRQINEQIDRKTWMKTDRPMCRHEWKQIDQCTGMNGDR
jgi:hypothetical protein